MLLTRPRTFVLSMSILGILGLISTLQSSRHTLLGQVLSTCGDGICSEAERTEIVLERDQRFGSAAANIGDIDGNQIDDIAVIAPSKTGTAHWEDQNSIWILFMNADRTVRSVHKILRTDSEFTQVVGIHDGFFHSIAPLGDLNGDGVPDIAVNVGGKLLILMLGNDGSVSSYQHITAVNGAPLNVTSLANAGDIDGDGVPDLLAGYTAALGGESSVTVLFLRQNGTVKNAKVITPADVEIAGLFTEFGTAVTGLGDIDGDGVPDIAIGAKGGYANSHGTVWIVHLQQNGDIQSFVKHNCFLNGFPFGCNPNKAIALGNAGDLDGDGINELLVGSPDEAIGGNGVIWIVYLNADGSVRAHRSIWGDGCSDAERMSRCQNFNGTQQNGDSFGFAVTGMGDRTLLIGAPTTKDSTGMQNTGALWLLSLDTNDLVTAQQEISNDAGGLTDSTLCTEDCCFADSDCDDGNLCTVNACNPDGSCTSNATNCDDNDPCTIDSCDETQGCIHEPNLTAPECIQSLCGNRQIDDGEECDDGNRRNDDGCGSECHIEDEWSCVGAPSVCRKNDPRTFDDHMANAMNLLSESTSHLSMSRDGQQLVYVQPTDGGPNPARIYFLDAEDRSVRELIAGEDTSTTFAQPIISANGTYVAVRRYSRHRTSGANNQVTLTYQTSVLRIKTEDSSVDTIVQHSIDTSRLSIPSSLSGLNPTELDAVISQDGKRVALVTMRETGGASPIPGQPATERRQMFTLQLWQEESQRSMPISSSVLAYPDDISIPSLLVQQMPTITALRLHGSTGRFVSFVAQKQKMDTPPSKKMVFEKMEVYVYDSRLNEVHTIATLASGDPNASSFIRKIQDTIAARGFGEAVEAKIAEILDTEPTWCGNGTIDAHEECETDSDCGSGGSCSECVCVRQIPDAVSTDAWQMVPSGGQGVVSYNGQLLAVDDGDMVMYGTGGWAMQQESIADVPMHYPTAFVHNGTLRVLAGDGLIPKAMYVHSFDEDAGHWKTDQSNLQVLQDMSVASHGGKVWLAGMRPGGGYRILSSEDGITFAPSKSFDMPVRIVTFREKLWAVSTTGVQVSDDGSEWRELQYDIPWRRLTSQNSHVFVRDGLLWVIQEYEQENRVYASADGITWQQITAERLQGRGVMGVVEYGETMLLLTEEIDSNEATFVRHQTQAWAQLPNNGYSFRDTSHLSMSRDGQQVAYVQPTNGATPARIYVLDAEDRSVRELIAGEDTSTTFAQPIISADGTYVAVRRYSRHRTSGANNQVTLTYQTSVLRIKTEDSSVDTIVQHSIDTSRLFIPASLSGLNPTELDVVISQDGKRVGFVMMQESGGASIPGQPAIERRQMFTLQLWQEGAQRPTPVPISVWAYPDDISMPSLLVQQMPTITALRLHGSTGRFVSFVAQKQKMDNLTRKYEFDTMEVYAYDSRLNEVHTIATLASGDPNASSFIRKIQDTIAARGFGDAVEATVRNIMYGEGSLCGNGVIDPGETCESDRDCPEGWACSACECERPLDGDPALDTWLIVPPTGGTLVSSGNTLLSIGGTDAHGNHSLVHTWHNDTWTPIGQLPSNAEGSAAIAFNGKLLVAGGYGSIPVGSSQGLQHALPMSMHVLQSSNGQRWDYAGPLGGAAARDVSAVFRHGKVWVGGRNKYNNRMRLFSSEDGRAFVEVKPSRVIPYGTLLSYKGIFYLVGQSQIYASRNGTDWSVAAPVPWRTTYASRNMVTFAHEGLLWILLGESSTGPMDRLFVSNNGTDWQEVHSLPFGNLRVHDATVHDGTLVLAAQEPDTAELFFQAHMDAARTYLGQHPFSQHLSTLQNAGTLAYVGPEIDGMPGARDAVYMLSQSDQDIRVLKTASAFHEKFTQPTISADGRYIAFRTYAMTQSENASMPSAIEWQDTLQGTGRTIAVFRNYLPSNDGLYPELDTVLSRNGQMLAFIERGVNRAVLRIWQIGTEPEDSVPIASMLIDSAATPATLNPFSALRFEDVHGRFLSFMFSGSASIMDNDAEATEELRLFDRETGLMHTVSTNLNLHSAAPEPEDLGSIAIGRRSRIRYQKLIDDKILEITGGA